MLAWSLLWAARAPPVLGPGSGFCCRSVSSMAPLTAAAAGVGVGTAACSPRRALRSRMGYRGLSSEGRTTGDLAAAPAGDMPGCWLSPTGAATLRRGPQAELVLRLPTAPCPCSSGCDGSGGGGAARRASGLRGGTGAGWAASGAACGTSAKRTHFVPFASPAAAGASGVALVATAPARVAGSATAAAVGFVSCCAGWGAPSGSSAPPGVSARSCSAGVHTRATGAAGSTCRASSCPLAAHQMPTAGPAAPANREAPLLNDSTVAAVPSASADAGCCSQSPLPACRHSSTVPSEQPAASVLAPEASEVTTRAPLLTPPRAPPEAHSSAARSSPVAAPSRKRHTLTNPPRAVAEVPSGRKQAALTGPQPAPPHTVASCAPSARPHRRTAPPASADSAILPQLLTATAVMQSARMFA